MGFLKEKSHYRPSRFERTLAWILTVGSGVIVARYLLDAWLAKG